MINHFAGQLALKEKINKGEPTLGLFVKTPSIHLVELLSGAGLDFVVFDAEHAPFSIEVLDRCLLAARAAGIKALVRVNGATSSLIQSALDMGAAGVIIAHIRSAQEARQAVAATRYAGGTRGFAASHRSAGYGDLAAASFLQSSDQSTIVIGQIEDAVAVQCIDDIAVVRGMDALFIGCADLAVSLGVEQTNDLAVQQAVDRICESCTRAQRSIGIFLPSTEAIDQFREKNISLFFISSDQSLLKQAAGNLVSDFKMTCS